MYCYFPDKRFGEDKVAWVTWITSDEGDLLSIDGNLALVLGEQVTAHELMQGQMTAVRTELICKWLIWKDALDIIHEFVWTRYTSYAQTVQLWIGADIHVLLKRQGKSLKKPMSRSWRMELGEQGKFVYAVIPPTMTQQLIVFPDLWTMHQQLPARVFEQPWVARRHSGLTTLQKATIYWWCTYGSIHTVITTPAGIFQNRYSLASISLVDGHKRWYKSAQDPRHRTPSVLTAFCEKFSCSFTSSGVFLPV